MIWQFTANGLRDGLEVEVQPPRASTDADHGLLEPQVEVRLGGPDGSDADLVVSLASDEAERLAAQLIACAADARDLLTSGG